jgi:hypothetical protein
MNSVNDDFGAVLTDVLDEAHQLAKLDEDHVLFHHFPMLLYANPSVADLCAAARANWSHIDNNRDVLVELHYALQETRLETQERDEVVDSPSENLFVEGGIIDTHVAS